MALRGGAVLRLFRAKTVLIAIVGGLVHTSETFAEIPPAETPPAIYFLIDASGSMEDHFTEAEKAVQDMRDRLLKADPNTPVSVTYFSADTFTDLQACNKAMVVSPASVQSVFNRELRSFRNDSSPLGAALQAAIIKAAGGPAKIVLVSDGDATPGCGPDLCDVAASMLPKEGIDVAFLPINASASNTDRLGCIAASQTKVLQPSHVHQAIKQNGLISASTITGDGHCPNSSSWEKWWWLFSFFAMAVSAIAMGVFYLIKSLLIENKTRSIELLDQAIRRGGAEAEEATAPLTAELKKAGVLATPAANGGEKVKEIHQLIQRVALKGLLWFIGVGVVLSPLLTLVFSNPNYTPFGVRMSVAKCEAWSTLNTEFASAFAVLFTALIFFMGSQIQRWVIASQLYYLAARDAKIAQDAHVTATQEQVFREYEAAYEAVADLAFVGTKFGLSEDDYQRVAENAKRIAADIKLERSIGEKILRSETAYLRQLRTSSRRFLPGSGSDIVAFVRELKLDRAGENQRENWKKLIDALAKKEAAKIADAAKALADTLKSDG